MSIVKENKRFGVGTKHKLTCGAEVTVLDYGGCFNVTVGDEEGNTKVIGSSELSAGHVSWPWFECAKIGRNFTLNCGVQVEVIKILSGSKVEISDAQGNSRSAPWTSLVQGTVSWKEFGVGSSHKGSEVIAVGGVFTLSCGVTVTVTKYEGCERVELTDDLGNTKWACAKQIRKRDVSWAEYGFLKGSKTRSEFPVGSHHKSNKCGGFSIVKVLYHDQITVVWDDSGYEQRGCNAYAIRSGAITDDSTRVNIDYLSPVKDMYYVYVAMFEGEVVYVGKGIGRRYLHVNSGGSHVVELNRIFFSGGQCDVSLHKDGLSEKDALREEKELIQKSKPKFNKMHACTE